MCLCYNRARTVIDIVLLLFIAVIVYIDSYLLLLSAFGMAGSHIALLYRGVGAAPAGQAMA